MKKTIIIVLMLTLTLSAFCQLKEVPHYKTSVLSLSGDNWVDMNYDSKLGFSIGVFWALEMLRENLFRSHNDADYQTLLSDNYGKEPAIAVDKYMEDLFNWCFLEGTAVDIMNVLDRVYSYKENRKYQIIEVLLMEYKKAWWTNNQKTQTPATITPKGDNETSKT